MKMSVLAFHPVEELTIMMAYCSSILWILNLFFLLDVRRRTVGHGWDKLFPASIDVIRSLDQVE